MVMWDLWRCSARPAANAKVRLCVEHFTRLSASWQVHLGWGPSQHIFFEAAAALRRHVGSPSGSSLGDSLQGHALVYVLGGP